MVTILTHVTSLSGGNGGRGNFLMKITSKQALRRGGEGSQNFSLDRVGCYTME